MIKIIFAAFLARLLISSSACSFYHIDPFFALFLHKIRAETEQLLPVQTGLSRYDEWMVQEINDENLMLTKLNVSYWAIFVKLMDILTEGNLVR